MTRSLLIAALLALLPSLAVAGSSSDLARTVTDVKGLEKLASSAFGGGSYEQVKGSRFFVADLMHTSGLFSTEIFIFEGTEDDLQLRLHLPRENSVVRKAEWSDGKPIIRERPQNKGEWKTILEFYPESPLTTP